MRLLVAACVVVPAALPLLAQSRGTAVDGTALLESSKCFDCHRIGERGSRVGPDLSDIGGRRSADQLRQAILKPDSDVLPQHRFVRVVTSDGTAASGRLLNQDAFSIQMMTMDERLKSYAKSSLREQTILDQGLMPSYEGKLNAQQIADIVSYLGSLKGGDTAAGGSASVSPGAVTHDRLLHPEREPQNWLTYGGSYASQRHSLLTTITRENVRQLTLKWVWRPKYLDKMETTPLVVDGVLYTVQNSEVVAVDAATGRTFWTFRYRVPPESNAYVLVVKGLAISGDRVFWATYDGHLIAIDAKTGTAIWNRTLLDYKKGLQLNVAPLVIKDKVILGPSTNEFGTNCWIAAYDVRTGAEVWRFNTVPGPGERGNETWPGDSWQHGGAPTG